MRENMGVYRGKTKDGEWVEGALLNGNNGRSFIITLCDSSGCFEGNPRLLYVEVDPETVGQWTGMKDKNGKRIFEGDIVNYDRLIGDVRYGKYLQSKCHEYACEHCGFYIAHEVYDGYCHDTGHSLKDEEQPYMEVIGNITDNKLEDFNAN